MSARCAAVVVYLGLIALLAAPVLEGAATAAETRAERQRAAHQLVEEALQCEVYGDSAQRDALLDRALELDPNCRAARWHRGFVWDNNTWVPADELAETDRQRQYERQRAAAGDVVADQLALANWCRDHKLAEQERAHLNRVLALSPNHPDARRRLGFRRVGNAWLTAQQIADEANGRRQLAENLAHWTPILRNHVSALQQRSIRKQQAAATAIREITDVSAIPALERVVSTAGEEAALLVVTALRNMPAFEASLSLARHAVLSEQEAVRAAAAESLQGRELDGFVPPLLAAMFTPIRSEVRVVNQPDGDILYRHAFVNEGQGAHQLLVLDTEYDRISRPGGDGRATLSRAAQSMLFRARQRELSLAQQNQFLRNLNRRIAWTLNLATDQELDDDPRSWWRWWTDYNEVYVKGEKPVRTIQDTDRVTLVDRASIAESSSGGGGGSGGPQRMYDCLAAGTIVWTSSGPRPIEQLQVGDRVLSQDPESGELAFKPVLETTVRPSCRLVRVLAGSEPIETSGGHLFWVSGDGWVRARHLKSGMELHGRSGTTRVSETTTGREVETYNLVVADFHTFFVGRDRVLTHDNTVRRPTNRSVPGL